MAMLETVPEVVMFRGWEKGALEGGAAGRRTLLLKNGGEEEVEALVTQPLSGLFELHSATQAGDEPEFFHTFTLPAKSTVKMVVLFKPDAQALQLYNNFQDVLIVHAPGAVMEIPIKACQSSRQPPAPHSGSIGDSEFCPSSSELGRWKRTLLLELGPPPPLPQKQQLEAGSTGNEPSRQPCAQLIQTGGGKETQPAQSLSENLMPPIGLSVVRRKEEGEPLPSEGEQSPPMLQPAVAIVGRTAVVSRQHAALRHPEASSRTELKQSLPQTSEPTKPTVFLINGILCDARGQPTVIEASSPSELRQRYNIIVCGQGSLDDHFSSGKPDRQAVRTPSPTETVPAVPKCGSFSMNALADAVAGLGLTLEDLPPNPAVAGMVASSVAQRTSSLPIVSGGRLDSSRSSGAPSSSPGTPSPPTPLQSRGNTTRASAYSPGGYKASPPSNELKGRYARMSTPSSKGTQPAKKLDQATLEANWDAL